MLVELLQLSLQGQIGLAQLTNHRLKQKTADQSQTETENSWPITGWRRKKLTNHRLKLKTADQSQVETENRRPITGWNRKQVTNHRLKKKTGNQSQAETEKRADQSQAETKKTADQTLAVTEQNWRIKVWNRTKLTNQSLKQNKADQSKDGT